jgi:hypothetical protein
MVNDEVWEASGPVGESRGTRFPASKCCAPVARRSAFGRTLTARDFTDAPVNDLEDWCYRSERPLDRLAAQTGASGSQAGLATAMIRSLRTRCSAARKTDLIGFSRLPARWRRQSRIETQPQNPWAA